MSACKYLLIWTLKSPRIVPGAASAGSVTPTSLRDDLTTLCPSHTWKHTNEESEYQLVNLHDSVWCVQIDLNDVVSDAKHATFFFFTVSHV